MFRRTCHCAFSLLEVVIAVALFAGSAAVVLALLPGLTRQAADTSDRLTAQRLADAVRVEMTRLAAPGLDSLAAKIPIMGDPATVGYPLVATRRGVGVQARDEPPSSGQIATADRYFLIECWRFPDAPLRYENGQPMLALCVRVSWPYDEAVASPAANAGEFSVVVSLNP